jgi:Ring finger domain
MGRLQGGGGEMSIVIHTFASASEERQQARRRAALKEAQTPGATGSFNGRYGVSCSTEASPLVQLIRNETSGKYIVGNVTESNAVNGRERRTSSTVFSHQQEMFPVFAQNEFSADPAFFPRRHGLEQSQVASLTVDPVLYGRLCVCSPVPETYCLDGVNICKIALSNPSKTVEAIYCSTETFDMQLRYMLPLIIFLFGLLACLCFCSPKGMYSRGYAKRLACCWQESQYLVALNAELDAMIQRNRNRREGYARARQRQQASHRVYLPVQRPELPGLFAPSNNNHAAVNMIELMVQNNPRKKAVVLKTRRMTAEDTVVTCSSNDPEGGPNMCAICLTTFCCNDRVGDLVCRHVFHVECLKSWIQQKNHCPLCQGNDLALPQEEPPPTARPDVLSLSSAHENDNDNTATATDVTGNTPKDSLSAVPVQQSHED